MGEDSDGREAITSSTLPGPTMGQVSMGSIHSPSRCERELEAPVQEIRKEITSYSTAPKDKSRSETELILTIPLQISEF